MKDIVQLTIYVSLTVGAILLLVAMSKMENLPSSALVITATMLVVVLPVIIGIRAAKKERERNAK